MLARWDGPPRREATDRDGTGDDGVVAVVVVDHGSRRAESNAAVRVVRAVVLGSPALPDRRGRPTWSWPSRSIGTAFDRCVAAGATVVAVAPWFLGPGSHWDRDLPDLTAEAAGPPPRGPVAGRRPARTRPAPGRPGGPAGGPVPRPRGRPGGRLRGVRRVGPVRAPVSDVVVIGAGAAGLVCALDLVRAGVDCTVVEASDGVGGRVRTDGVDGFLLDRGFQILLTAYPEVRRRLDLAPSTSVPSPPAPSCGWRTGSTRWPTRGGAPGRSWRR